jgi:hypothetical protein
MMSAVVSRWAMVAKSIMASGVSVTEASPLPPAAP